MFAELQTLGERQRQFWSAPAHLGVIVDSGLQVGGTYGVGSGAEINQSPRVEIDLLFLLFD